MQEHWKITCSVRVWGSAARGNSLCSNTGKQRAYCDCRDVNCGGSLCRSNHCSTFATASYDGFCTHCFQNLFPDDPRCAQIRARTKEMRVVHHVLAEHAGLDWIHDKPLYVNFDDDCACTSKRRCDLRAVVGGTMLVVECDEGQHKAKAYADTRDARYNDLFVIYSGKWVFLRFNPDNYRDGGVLRKTSWETRLARLSEEIEHQIARINSEANEDLVDIVHLFFDQ